MDNLKSRIKPLVSAGCRDVTVLADSAAHRVPKNRFFNIKKYFIFFSFQKNIIIFRIKKYFF
jgi:hypothetical protein